MKNLLTRLGLLVLLLLAANACDYKSMGFGGMLWWSEPLGVQMAGINSQPTVLQTGPYKIKGSIFPQEDRFINKVRLTLDTFNLDGGREDRIRKTIRVRDNEFFRNFNIKNSIRLDLGFTWNVEVEALPNDDALDMADFNIRFRYQDDWQNIEAADSGDLDLDIEFLVNDVRKLVRAGTVPEGQGGALMSSLETARELLEDGNDVRAMMELMSFMDQVDEAAESGSLPPDEADDLTLTANGIADELMVPAR